MPTIAEALVNRRDQAQPPESVRFGHPMDDTNELLRKIASQEEANLMQLCLTDREPEQEIRRNFPIRGVDRRILRRTGEGGDYLLTANAPTLILEAAEWRIGGEIVNIGSAAVKLYLTVDLIGIGGVILSGGVPIIGLNASGGSWNLQFNQSPWCGNVMAVAGTGGSEVTVAAF